MAQFTRDINVKLNDGETERFVVQTFKDDAIKVELSATGEPYDVDIQTSDEHPQNNSEFNQNDYISSLPLGSETYTDTFNHVTAAEAIDLSTLVSITNNSGGERQFTGIIKTHSKSAPSTIHQFATQDTGNRALAYRDGRSIGNSISIRSELISLLEAKIRVETNGDVEHLDFDGVTRIRITPGGSILFFNESGTESMRITAQGEIEFSDSSGNKIAELDNSGNLSLSGTISENNVF